MHPNSYDLMPYLSLPFAQTHPDHLASIATLFGLTPPTLDGCRVLELGCASGGNLLPLAEQIPGVEGIGIDLSSHQIGEGQALCTTLGLAQMRLVAGSITDIDASWGEFDFILCHGVYSWVPPEVQSAILRVCRERLRPQGIAYVSYNTLPGWRMRGAIRDLMRHHALGFDDPREQVGQARAILDFLVEASAAADPAYGSLLRQEAELLGSTPDSYIFHEHLEDMNEPIYFREFVERAARHGLKYLAESDFAAMLSSTLPPKIGDTVQRIAPDIIGQEQLLDFVRNRTFRQTLLVHEHVAIERQIPLERIDGLRLASPLRATACSGDTEHFAAPDGATLSTAAPLSRAALRALGDCWPGNLRWDELLATLRGQAGLRLDPAALATLRADLLHCYANRLLSLHTRPLRCAVTPSMQPLASALARQQARHGHRVTTLRHEIVQLDDAARALIQLLDGRRDRRALIAALAADWPGFGEEACTELLQGLARAALLLH